MKKHLHILGICGTFMGGLAVIARQLGYRVTGSDANSYPPMSETLASHDIDIYDDYALEHLQPHPDLVLVGNVLSRGHPVVEYLIEQNIPYCSGPEWLAREVLAVRDTLVVSGTHGKTTVSSMLAWILECVGLQPGFLIGGVANNFTTTARLGSGPYFVIEGDEYDTAFFDKVPKFLHYDPVTLVINNIEFDHADIYEDIAAIKKQFQLLISKKTIGKIVYNANDSNIVELLTSDLPVCKESYGAETSEWQYRVTTVGDTAFSVYHQGKDCGTVDCSLLGSHNKENALAAIAAAFHLRISPKSAIAALNKFQGVRRRMEYLGKCNDAVIYDDFAHHPTAIARSLAGLREKVSDETIIAVLQFASNTMKSGKHHYQDLVAALSIADRVLLLDSPDYDVDINQIRQAMQQPMAIFDSVDAIVDELKNTLKKQDNVLIMSNKQFGGLQQKLLL